MMYPLLMLDDRTEIVHSEMLDWVQRVGPVRAGPCSCLSGSPQRRGDKNLDYAGREMLPVP